MLLPMIQVIDEQHDAIVKCVVLRDLGDCIDVKPLEPMLYRPSFVGAKRALIDALNLSETSEREQANFDPTEWQSSNRAIFMAVWRIRKDDGSAEPMDTTFDTSCLPESAESKLLELIGDRAPASKS
jgi:hypothetical protein